MRERGLKSLTVVSDQYAVMVAPVRERGLKYRHLLGCSWQLRRSREGAWIEIQSRAHPSTWPHSRSREGAWIEMPSHRRRRHIGAESLP